MSQYMKANGRMSMRRLKVLTDMYADGVFGVVCENEVRRQDDERRGGVND